MLTIMTMLAEDIADKEHETRERVREKLQKANAAYEKWRIKREIYERNLYRFAEAAWPNIDPTPFIGGGFAMSAVCDQDPAGAVSWRAGRGCGCGLR